MAVSKAQVSSGAPFLAVDGIIMSKVLVERFLLRVLGEKRAFFSYRISPFEGMISVFSSISSTFSFIEAENKRVKTSFYGGK